MKLNINSTEAQMLVDELSHSILQREKAEPDYTANLKKLKQKILDTSHKSVVVQANRRGLHPKQSK